MYCFVGIVLFGMFFGSENGLPSIDFRNFNGFYMVFAFYLFTI